MDFVKLNTVNQNATPTTEEATAITDPVPSTGSSVSSDQVRTESPTADGEAAANDGAAATLIECSECGNAIPPSLFHSTLDCCQSCAPEVEKRARKEADRQYWAEQRAAGKAAFMVHNSARGALNKGTAVAYCCNCTNIVTGSKAIKRHFDHCRRT